MKKLVLGSMIAASLGLSGSAFAAWGQVMLHYGDNPAPASISVFLAASNVYYNVNSQGQPEDLASLGPITVPDFSSRCAGGTCRSPAIKVSSGSGLSSVHFNQNLVNNMIVPSGLSYLAVNVNGPTSVVNNPPSIYLPNHHSNPFYIHIFYDSSGKGEAYNMCVAYEESKGTAGDSNACYKMVNDGSLAYAIINDE